MVNPVTKMSEPVTVTIASGQSLSSAVDLGGRKLVGILMPATWTAADLTIQGSINGTTFGNVYTYAGDEYTVDADVSRFIALDPANLLGIEFLKIRSGTAASPVNQAGDRSLVAVLAAL